MKKGFNILLILCTALVAISCSKTKSYTDMLKDEKEAIERLIDANDFEILDDFPKDSIFKENQFVKLENGVYLNIIDKGSSERAVQYKTKMLYRCKLHYILEVDTLVYENYGFYAVKGGKAYLDGNEIHVSDVSVLDNAFIALGFPYNSDAYRPVAAHLVDGLYGFAGGTRLMGSAAAELCYVAAGRFDARIEAFLGPWDVAAGALILLQAGGKISDFNGGENWASGEQVVASNGKIHSLVLSLLP